MEAVRTPENGRYAWEAAPVEEHHDAVIWSPASRVGPHPRRRSPAADGRGAGALREPRPLLPLALRPALQLRADVGPSWRLDLLGSLRGGHPLRRGRLRARLSRPRGRGRRLLRRGPQGDGP